jgi:diacylglycerol O-acyltransferase / wax synthase
VGERVDVFMRDSDAFSWYMEKDPVLRSQFVSIAWFDQSPDWDAAVAKFERLSREIPMLRQRPLESPGRLATPRWTTVSDFDLSWHLRRVDSPTPHTPATVVELARVAVMAAFDPARPLWEFTLVDHLEGGGAALVMKLHHSLTDGMGGLQLALSLFDDTAEPVPPGAIPDAPSGESLTLPDLLRASLTHDWHRVLDAVRGAAEWGAPAAVHALQHPLQSVEDLVETTRSVGRTVQPVADTLSPVMTGRSIGRHLDMLTLRLDDLKRASAAAEGSVNDGFMTAVAGGLRRYHERHGVTVDELRVTLPINIRSESDPIAGNRLTLQRFRVPVGNTDVVERTRAMAKACRAARSERSLPLTDAIAGTLNLLPLGVVAGMLRHVDFVASNVPGFPYPVYMAGARLVGWFPFGPTVGASLNVTLLSYDGTCGVGVNVDTAAVADPDVLVACLREGFEELLGLGGDHVAVVVPLLDGVYPGEPPG